MNLGLSDKLKLAFPDLVPVGRPLVENPKILDPKWLAGFTSGEGCFLIGLTPSKSNSTGYRVYLVFQLSQHSRDEYLIRSILKFLDCGLVIQRGEAFDFRVTKFKDIWEKIIPFFKKYPGSEE